MSLPRYPEYKDSGVEWLGEVPSHWAVRKFRHAFQESSEKIDGDVFGPMLSVSGYRGIEIKDYDDENRRRTDEELQGYRIVRPGQLVVNTMWLNYAGLGVSPHEGHVSPAYRAYSISEDLEPRFVHHMMRSGEFVKGYTKFLTGIRPNSLQMSRDDLMEFRLAEPPRDEQASIADFLDRETARIDALIAEQETLLALLAEKRQATISHAVTRGLDPNVPMKDSGIAWLGEVPAHWEIVKIGSLLTALGDVDHFMPPSVDQGVPYLMTGDLKECASDVSFEDCKNVSREDYLQLSRRIKCSKGDVIMARYATIGTVMYVDIDIDFLVSYSCVTLKPDCSKVSGTYLFHFMKSDAFMQGLESQINTNTQGNVGISGLKGVVVATPPVEEQASIVNVVTATIERIDKLKAESDYVISLLKERRSALISAAVTGQIDVRGLVSEEAT